MYSFCRLAFLLALGLPAIQTVQAQSSSSTPPASAPDQAQVQQSASQTSGQLSVQARIRARREQRRAAAIREAYSHRYEGYLGGGCLRFRLPSPLQRVNELNWDGGFTRYFDERLGVTLDGRGLYGTAFVYPNGSSNITKPSIGQYAALIGPSYRFYIQPKYSIAGRVMGGFAYGNFSGDTGGNTAISHGVLGLYPDGTTYAVSASIVGEYNVSPSIAVRVAPEYFLTGFGSSMQNDLGFTAGIVYRFGKQK